MKRIVLLGASGSIGIQTIDVVLSHSDEFEITALSIGYNVQQLREILVKIHPAHVCVAKKEDAQFYEKLGVDKIVLPRELSIENIKEIILWLESVYIFGVWSDFAGGIQAGMVGKISKSVVWRNRKFTSTYT